MKQVLNGVKASRARLVLLAPDTEVSDVLDNKVALIIQEAKERNIPVLYCLTRRKLGKSLGMSMKQSAAAIYDPSGVHDAFTKIIKFVELFHLAKTNLSLELPIGNLSLAVNASMDEYSQPMSPITPNESRSIVNSQSMAKVRANEIISNISTTAEMKNTTNEPEDSESINNSIIQSPAVSKIKFQEQEHDVSTNRLSIESSVSMITNPEDRLFTLPEDSVAVDDFKSVGTKGKFY